MRIDDFYYRFLNYDFTVFLQTKLVCLYTLILICYYLLSLSYRLKSCINSIMFYDDDFFPVFVCIYIYVETSLFSHLTLYQLYGCNSSYIMRWKKNHFQTSHFALKYTTWIRNAQRNLRDSPLECHRQKNPARARFMCAHAHTNPHTVHDCLDFPWHEYTL